MEENSTQVQDVVNKLQDEHQKIQKIYAEQRKSLDDNMTISGKTVKEWRDELWIIVPSADLNPQICLELNMAIARAEGIAAYEHAKAEMRSQILDSQASSAYDHSLEKIVSDYKGSDQRVPGSATLATMAEVASELYKKIAIEGNNELKFWKNILNHLTFCKHIIEQAGFNLNSALKSDTNERLLENLGRRYGGNQ